MALIDKASLLMVPSTYEAGTLYNVLPSGNRAPDSTDQNSGYDQTRADFDFDRGSNAAATRVNASGLIEKYRENLLLQSNNFSNGWSLTTGSSITGGQTGYDGSNDAWLLNDSGNSTAYAIYRGYTNTGVQTFSLYAKQASTSQIEFDFLGGSGGYLRVELTDGSLHQTNNSIDYNIENVGNGWYRCSFAVNQTSAPILVRIGCNGAGSVYIQSAQLESGLVASSYLESTSVTGKAGVLVDLPRINYDANGENGALLLEPSRANLVAFSEYLNGGIWIQTGSSVTDNDATSPEGLTNAAKVQGDGSQTYIRLYDNLTFPSAGNYTLSVFAKAGNNDFLRLVFGGVTGGNEAYFDLVNGTTEETWATIEPVGTDGWYRCSITADLTGPDLTGNYNFYVSYSYTDRNFPSAGDANGQYVYLYGAQVEANATYPTSYIPTMGTSETRAADSCSVTGVSDVMPTSYPFTLYAEMDVKAIGDEWGISFLDVSANNKYYVIGVNSSKKYSILSRNNTASSVQSTANATKGTHKICGLFTATTLKLFVDGVLIGSSNNAQSLVSSANDLLLGQLRVVSDTSIRNNVRQAMIFNEALTDAECITLTTL